MSDEFDTGEPQLPEALLRALRAPGTHEELAGEADVLAAFRAARPGTPRLRLVGRLGVGGVAMVSALALGSGVAAAAFTNNLPQPVQQLAHSVLAPIGVPAAQPRHRGPSPTVTALTSPSTSPSRPARKPSPTPVEKQTRGPSRGPSNPPANAPTPGGAPVATASPPGTPGTPSTAEAPTALPTASATSSSTITASPTSSPTTGPTRPPKPVPASVSLTLSTTHVAAGSTILATGSALDADGNPAARQKVTLQANAGTGWTSVDSGVTDRLGTVSLYSPAITQNTRFRLKVANRSLTRPLRSTVGRVTETPELVVTFSDGALQIAAVGAQPGDLVRIGVVRSGTVTQVGTVTLSGSGATFQIDPSTSKQRFVVVLPRTGRHAAAKASVTVPHA